MIKNLYHDQVFTAEEGNLILAALSDQNFKGLPEQSRRIIRANLMKSMLLTAVK